MRIWMWVRGRLEAVRGWCQVVWDEDDDPDARQW